MIAPLGHLAIILALALALAGAWCSVGAGLRGDRRMAAWGRRLAYGVALCVTAAVGLLLAALIGHDFSVRYVQEVGSRETPLYYTIASLWSSLDGSILYWAFLLSLYTSLFLWRGARRVSDLVPWITAILLGLSAFFLFVIAGPDNPFASVTPVADGPGPNPLLQNHWMMGVHPQLLYLGYVGLSIPFAVTMASLIRGGPDGEVFRTVRRWTLIPWMFLSLGIVAGMWWSYAVLGWGGYWSWDPVENASVMPWLVTTAFLHSLQVQERRQMLKTWTVTLVAAAFLLSILGTFLTRSGILPSVHAFTQSAIGPLFLGFLAVLLAGTLALLFLRGPQLAAAGSLQAVVCRETAFLVNNLLLVAITFTILLGTLFPLVAEALQGTQLSVGAPYFNSLAVPMGVALLFLMGLGPLLPWGATRPDVLQWRLLPPVGTGAGVILLALALGLRGVGALATFGLAGAVLAVSVGRILADIRSRRRNVAETWTSSAGRVLTANPRRYGGYLAHIGVALVVIGIAASQTYAIHSSATLRPGQSATIDGYTLTYLDLQATPQPNRMVLAAAVDVHRGTQDLGIMYPSQNAYAALLQPVITPAVREEPLNMLLGLAAGRSPLPDLAQILRGRNPFEDLYLVLEAADTSGASTHRSNRWATIQVLVSPLVGFIWLGGSIVGLGGLVALLPARRRQRVPAAVPMPVLEEATP